MRHQLAKVRPQPHLRLDRDVLVPKEDHLVRNQGIVHLPQALLIDGVEVDAVNLSAKHRREPRDG
jgi:hypothetical protein